MTKYRKKPVEVEAVRLIERTEIRTLEGTMVGNPGDWLITGIAGEKYPCKDDIFRATYEIVTNDETGEEPGSKLCADFKPNPWYRPRCGNFCVERYCDHWVPKKTICIDADPAGNTYEIIDAHCGLDG
jgi:hypothetical protein